MKNVRELKEQNKKKAFSSIFQNIGFSISIEEVIQNQLVSQEELSDFIRIFLKVVENKKSEIEVQKN